MTATTPATTPRPSRGRLRIRPIHFSITVYLLAILATAAILITGGEALNAVVHFLVP